MKRKTIQAQLVINASSEMANGLIDADLGSGLLKKRIPIHGRGKRSGARAIVTAQSKQRWFFLMGYDKNERTTVEHQELKALQHLASIFQNFTKQQIQLAIKMNELIELKGTGHEQ